MKIVRTIASATTAVAVLAGGVVATSALGSTGAHAASFVSVQANTGNPGAGVTVYRAAPGGSYVAVAAGSTDRRGRFYANEPAGYWYTYGTSATSLRNGVSPCYINTYGAGIYASGASTIVTVPWGGQNENCY